MFRLVVVALFLCLFALAQGGGIGNPDPFMPIPSRNDALDVGHPGMPPHLLKHTTPPPTPYTIKPPAGEPIAKPRAEFRIPDENEDTSPAGRNKQQLKKIVQDINDRYMGHYNNGTFKDMVESVYHPNAVITQDGHVFKGHEQILAALTKDGSQIQGARIERVYQPHTLTTPAPVNGYPTLVNLVSPPPIPNDLSMPIVADVTTFVRTPYGLTSYHAVQKIRHGFIERVDISPAGYIYGQDQ